jgi:hypothetical protein
MRNSIVLPLTQSPFPDREHADARREFVDADDGALVQGGPLVSKHPHDVRADSVRQDVLGPDLKHARAKGLVDARMAEKSRSWVITTKPRSRAHAMITASVAVGSPAVLQ